MPRATLLPDEKIYYNSKEACVLHSYLRDIDGQPGDILDIYDTSGQFISKARYVSLSEYDLEKMEYLGEVSATPSSWESFAFYHDRGSDRYYVAKWWPSGVDLSGNSTSGGWAIPKEDVMKEPTEEYIRKLENYCRK